ncbi:MAG: cation diffusion facilitator family transporter [Defluviitaleaceae bacterium]|nr:cation diffusion facilitator family transporter [Defluviitaleaceae bacterium]
MKKINFSSTGAVVLGAAANFLLFIAKLFIGLFLNSIAIIADSINNLSDLLSNFVVLYGIKISKKPADKEHPFGHGRAEYLVTFIISAAIIFVGFEFFRSSIGAIFNENNIEFNLGILAILLLSNLVKLFLYFFYKKIGTGPLIALSKDSLGDVFITSATILAIFFPHLDGFLGALISIFIVYNGYSLAKGVVSKILGEQLDPELVKQIKFIVEKEEKILSTHDLILHSYGSKKMGTLHVEMDETLTLVEAHEVVDTLEREVKKNLNIDLTIHIDPQTNDFLLKDIKEKIITYLNFVESSVEAHDFKMNYSSEVFEVIFELSFPHNYEKTKEELLRKSIEMLIKDKGFSPVIEVEYKYHE